MKHNMGFHYMNRFKSPAKGFVFVFWREDTLPCCPLQGSWILYWALGGALCFLPTARQPAYNALLNFQGCPATRPLCPGPGWLLPSAGAPGREPRPPRAPHPPALRARPRVSGGGGRGGSGGGSSRPGHRPRPARGSTGCCGPSWRGGASGGAGARLPVRLRGEKEKAVRPQRRALGPPAAGQTHRGRGPGARSVSGGSAGGARRGGGAGSREPGAGGGEGGGGRGAGSARGSGPRPSPWLVWRAASAPRQRKAQPPLASPTVSFLSNQRKINTREGKTIAGPPGTRRARSSHVWGGGRRWNGEWRPHGGAPSRCAPAEGGATRGAGLGRRRREFPGVRRVGKVLQEQSGFPQLPCCGQGN